MSATPTRTCTLTGLTCMPGIKITCRPISLYRLILYVDLDQTYRKQLPPPPTKKEGTVTVAEMI